MSTISMEIKIWHFLPAFSKFLLMNTILHTVITSDAFAMNSHRRRSYGLRIKISLFSPN